MDIKDQQQEILSIVVENGYLTLSAHYNEGMAEEVLSTQTDNVDGKFTVLLHLDICKEVQNSGSHFQGNWYITHVIYSKYDVIL